MNPYLYTVIMQDDLSGPDLLLRWTWLCQPGLGPHVWVYRKDHEELETLRSVAFENQQDAVAFKLTFPP